MAAKTKLEIRKAISDYRNYVNETIVDAIIKPVGKSKESFAEKFIAKYLSNALRDTSSKEAQTLANILIKPDSLEQLQKYEASNKSVDADMVLWKINNTLYDKQQEVFSGFLHNAYKRYLIINSRRTGKTELMGRLIVANLVSSNDAHVVYINRTSSAAIRQIKKPLATALAQTNLQIIKGSVDSQFIEFSNGSQLLIIGNNNAADIDRVRGERISLCIMDECGHQRNTKQIVREVIEPAMTDYGKDAKLVLVGTPPRNAHTYVEEVYNNAISLGWKTFHWTFIDNPHLPDRDLIIDDVCKSNGCSKDSAFIRREYYGEMNAYDTDALWIKKYSYNPQERIPNGPLYAYIGVDWGYEDKAAVVSVIADKQTQRAYIVNSWSEEHRGITEVSNEVINQIKYLKDNYNLIRDPWVICDNNEKGAVADLSLVYHIPNVFTAYKYDLDFAQDQLNELFSTNKIMVVNDPSNRVREDCESSMWQRDEESDKILHILDDDIWHPNALMSVLYITRQFAFEILGWTDKNKAVREIIRS